MGRECGGGSMRLIRKDPGSAGCCILDQHTTTAGVHLGAAHDAGAQSVVEHAGGARVVNVVVDVARVVVHAPRVAAAALQLAGDGEGDAPPVEGEG